MRQLTWVLITLAVCAHGGVYAQQKKKSWVDPQTPKKVFPLVLVDTITTKQLRKDWKLVFSDEFNDRRIDTVKWNVETSIKKRVDITLYANEDQVEEKDGRLYLYYRKAPISDTAYYVGRVHTKEKYAATFGYFECRMHVVKPNGHQTAFWMMPQGTGMQAPAGVDGGARDGAEIDIVEGTKANQFSLGLHWDGYAKPAHKSNGRLIQAPNMHDTEFHVYGFEWSPTRLRFYFDGKVVAVMTDPKLIPQVAHFLLVTASCFGQNNWVDGDIRTNKWIQSGNTDKAYIDYIRVFRQTNLNQSN